ALPRKVGDRLFCLEPVVRRNDRRPAVQNRWQAAGDRVDAQSAARRRREETQGGCRSDREDIQGQFASFRSDHQYAGEGQGNFRSLARLQGRCGLAASREPCRERSGGGVGLRGARSLSETLASLLFIEGEMVRQEAIAALGPQCAAAENRAAYDSLDRRA